MNATFALLLPVVTVLWGTLAWGADLPRPMEREAEVHYQQLVARKFGELDRIAQDALKANAMISDGQPRLAAVYAGTAGCLTGACRSRLNDAQWSERLARIEEWRAKAPESVAAEVSNALYYLERAWAIRGQGYASSVREDAWKPFNENVARALDALERARPAARDDPGWHGGMLSVGLVQGWPQDRFEKAYEAAATRHPGYLPIHFTAAAYYAPRWRGSIESLGRFVDRVVERTRPQLGETMYARLHWALWTRSMFADRQADWPRMRAGFDRMVADYPDPWNVNNFGKFACLAGDAPTVVRLSKQIGDQPIEAAWMNSREVFDRCVNGAIEFEKRRAEGAKPSPAGK